MSKETLFALSLFPYLGFLWFLSRSEQTPRLALVGFYMTLVFVAVTIPAGIYAQVAYGEALANVDVLHGGAEFFLTLSNVLVLLGFRQAIRQKQQNAEPSQPEPSQPEPLQSEPLQAELLQPERRSDEQSGNPC
jgi:heme A synthase